MSGISCCGGRIKAGLCRLQLLLFITYINNRLIDVQKVPIMPWVTLCSNSGRIQLLTCHSKLTKAIRSADYLMLPWAFITTSRALGVQLLWFLHCFHWLTSVFYRLPSTTRRSQPAHISQLKRMFWLFSGGGGIRFFAFWRKIRWVDW